MELDGSLAHHGDPDHSKGMGMSWGLTGIITGMKVEAEIGTVERVAGKSPSNKGELVRFVGEGGFASGDKKCPGEMRC